MGSVEPEIFAGFHRGGLCRYGAICEWQRPGLTRAAAGSNYTAEEKFIEFVTAADKRDRAGATAFVGSGESGAGSFGGTEKGKSIIHFGRRSHARGNRAANCAVVAATSIKTEERFIAPIARDAEPYRVTYIVPRNDNREFLNYFHEIAA